MKILTFHATSPTNDEYTKISNVKLAEDAAKESTFENDWQSILLRLLGGVGTIDAQAGVMQDYTPIFTGGGIEQAQADYDAYFNTAKAGDVTPWLGGYLTMNDQGEAVWTAPEGQKAHGLKLTAGMKIPEFTGNKYIRDMYSDTYGIDPRDIGESTWNDWYGDAVAKAKTFTPAGGYTSTNFLNTPHTLAEYNNPTYKTVNTSTAATPATNAGKTTTDSTTTVQTSGPCFAEQAYVPDYLKTPQAQSDWKSYFTNTAPGTVTNWAGGTLTMGQNGQAIYNDQYGAEIPINVNTSLGYMYALLGVKAAWDKAYGTTGTNIDKNLLF
jgi:hypothetical protein